MSMSSQKPYLIRAIYQWLLDNDCTPYLLVNTDYEGVVVPEQYIRDSRIVLNLAPDAIDGLNMDNDWVSFSARFSGKAIYLFRLLPFRRFMEKKITKVCSFQKKSIPRLHRQQLKNQVNQPIKRLMASQA
mgnify:CR=1 FL=1